MRALLLALALAGAGARAKAPKPAPAPPAEPVALELFTSQGSAGSLPTERLLSSWGAELFKSGWVLPLAFHVDTLDELGWKDPFSLPESTARQAEYADKRDASKYVPQFVLGGKDIFMGGNRPEAEARLRSWTFRPPVAKLTLSPPRRDRKGRLVMPVAVELTTLEEKSRRKYRVCLVVFENGLTTQVAAGENAGQALRNDFVVRCLKDLGGLRKDDRRPWSKEAELPWQASWKPENAGAALLLQDDDSLEQRGLALLYPLPPIPPPPARH